jgi:hypothetical protein
MNVIKTKFSLPILAYSLLAFTTLVNANQGNVDQYTTLHKQLAIMSNVIKSSTKYGVENEAPKISTIETTYLKGQGVVFTVKTSSRFFNMSRFNFSMPDIPDMPRVPVVADISDRFDGDIGEIIEDAMDVASQSWEMAVESTRDDREAYRELRGKQRELKAKKREVAREANDLTYQLRRADKKSKVELAKQQAKLAKHQKQLELENKKLVQKVAQLKVKQKAKKAQRTKQQQNYYQSLSKVIGESLCSYGNALKALPKNEKVSVILKGAAQQQQHKDKIYVFNKQDILNCVIDKISSTKLVANSEQYEF